MTKIAIVDDALLIRMQMKKFFEEVMKFEVIALGADGNEAIDIYREKKPDLMTLDLTMPNKSGIDAIKEIINENPKAKILVVSAIKDSALITEALQIGASSFINKPLQFASESFVASFVEEIKDILDNAV